MCPCRRRSEQRVALGPLDVAHLPEALARGVPARLPAADLRADRTARRAVQRVARPRVHITAHAPAAGECHTESAVHFHKYPVSMVMC